MNTQQIIKELPDLNRDQRAILSKLANMFDMNAPRTLYMNYYELSEEFPHTSPHQWETFLDIPEVWRFRSGKIAKLQEFAAVKAMKALENDPSASNLKELIKTSKSMNAGQQREKIILTYVRPKTRNQNEQNLNTESEVV